MNKKEDAYLKGLLQHQKLTFSNFSEVFISSVLFISNNLFFLDTDPCEKALNMNPDKHQNSVKEEEIKMFKIKEIRLFSSVRDNPYLKDMLDKLKSLIKLIIEAISFYKFLNLKNLDNSILKIDEYKSKELSFLNEDNDNKKENNLSNNLTDENKIKSMIKDQIDILLTISDTMKYISDALKNLQKLYVTITRENKEPILQIKKSKSEINNKNENNEQQVGSLKEDNKFDVLKINMNIMNKDRINSVCELNTREDKKLESENEDEDIQFKGDINSPFNEDNFGLVIKELEKNVLVLYKRYSKYESSTNTQNTFLPLLDIFIEDIETLLHLLKCYNSILSMDILGVMKSNIICNKNIDKMKNRDKKRNILGKNISLLLIFLKFNLDNKRKSELLFNTYFERKKIDLTPKLQEGYCISPNNSNNESKLNLSNTSLNKSKTDKKTKSAKKNKNKKKEEEIHQPVIQKPPSKNDICILKDIFHFCPFIAPKEFLQSFTENENLKLIYYAFVFEKEKYLRKVEQRKVDYLKYTLDNFIFDDNNDNKHIYGIPIVLQGIKSCEITKELSEILPNIVENNPDKINQKDNHESKSCIPFLRERKKVEEEIFPKLIYYKMNEPLKIQNKDKSIIGIQKLSNYLFIALKVINRKEDNSYLKECINIINHGLTNLKNDFKEKSILSVIYSIDKF